MTLYGKPAIDSSVFGSPSGPYIMDMDIGKKHCPCSCFCIDFLFFLGLFNFLPDKFFLESSSLSCFWSADVQSSHFSSLHLSHSSFLSSLSFSYFLSSSVFGCSDGTGINDLKFFFASPEKVRIV